MLLACLCFSLTVVLLGMVAELPQLGSYILIGLLLCSVASYSWFRKHKRCFLLFLGIACGWLWAMGWGLWHNQYELPWRDMVVTGRIASLPQFTDNRVRFEFAVNTLAALHSPELERPSQVRKLRISWYGFPKDARILPGQKWRFKIRAFRPHSFINPNGFDYEGWMFQRGIQGNGYVRGEAALLESPRGYLFSRLRLTVRQKIDELNASSTAKSIITALMIGDRSHFTDETWQVLFRTGTSHLIAISGLHISLVGGLIFWLIFLFLKRISLFQIPPLAASACITLFCIWIYAFSVGLSLPTQRAAIMLSIFLFSLIFMRRPDLLLSYVIALAAVLLGQPLSGFNGGFYLSFAAVAVVLLSSRHFFNQYSEDAKGKFFHYCKQLILLQFILVLCLAPWTLLFFNAFSPLGLLINLAAIPLTSFILMPWILGTWLLLFSIPSLGQHSLQLLAEVMDLLSLLLRKAAALDWAIVHLPQPHLLLIILAVIGSAVWLFQPRPYFYFLGLLFFAPVFFSPSSAPSEGTVRITFLDVGQGLAVHLRTTHHNLLYDAGPRYSAGFDAGSDIIAPYLHSYGLTRLDRIIISHYDMDHRGGLEGLLQHIKADELMFNFKFSDGRKRKTIPCSAIQQWMWDGVSFQVLHPATDYVGQNRNNKSCVILVTTGDNKLLLTGDIEMEVEKLLHNKKLRVNILQVPHHGSASSSHPQWIESLDPDYAVFSAGYGNPFSHPATEVMERYINLGSIPLVSWQTGAIEFDMNAEKVVYTGGERLHNKRYWH